MTSAKLFLSSVFVLFSIHAQTPLAVLDFEANGITAAENSALINRLRNELFKLGTYQVVERDLMEEILDEQGFQQSACTTNECLVSIGKLIGVKQIVGGSISVVGDIYTVSARIIDVGTGELIKVTDYDIRGDVGELLTKGMRQVAFRLSTDKKDVLSISSSPPENRILSELGYRGWTLPSIHLPNFSLVSGKQLWDIRFGFIPPFGGFSGDLSYKIANKLTIMYFFEFVPYATVGFYSYQNIYNAVTEKENGFFAVLSGRKNWHLDFATVSLSTGLGLNWLRGWKGYDWNELYSNADSNHMGFNFQSISSLGLIVDQFAIPIMIETNFLYLPYMQKLVPYLTVGIRL